MHQRSFQAGDTREVTMRYMGLLKADKNSAAGRPSSREVMEKMARFMEEVTLSGETQTVDGLLPTSHSACVRLAGGRVTVTDGSFSEPKELVASYAMFEVKSLAEAIEWTTGFLKALGEGECEIRPLFETSDDVDVYAARNMRSLAGRS